MDIPACKWAMIYHMQWLHLICFFNIEYHSTQHFSQKNKAKQPQKCYKFRFAYVNGEKQDILSRMSIYSLQNLSCAISKLSTWWSLVPTTEMPFSISKNQLFAFHFSSSNREHADLWKQLGCILNIMT